MFGSLVRGMLDPVQNAALTRTYVLGRLGWAGEPLVFRFTSHDISEQCQHNARIIYL